MTQMQAITEINDKTRARIRRKVAMTIVQDGYRDYLERRPSLRTALLSTCSFYAIGAGVRITLAKERQANGTA